HHSWYHGLGYSLIPLAAYLCVFRYGRRHYFAGAILVSALYAISSSQPLTGMAFFASLALAVMVTQKHKLARMIFGIGIPGVLVVFNWAESLYAKVLIGPLTFRGDHYSFGLKDIGTVIDRFGVDLLLSTSVSILVVIALVLLAIRKPEKLMIPLLVSAVALWSGTILNQVPWRDFGLGLLSGFNFSYITHSITFVGLMVVALTDGILRIAPVSRFVAIAALSLALGKFAWFKAVNLPVWLSDGGVPVLSENIKKFQNPDWAPKQPFRVVTIPYRLAPNMPPAVGLDALDGLTSLVLRSSAYFWTRGVLDVSPSAAEAGFMMINPPELDYKCCNSYDVTDFMDLDFLRIANVGYILSTLPLHGGGLSQVAGPADANAPPRNTLPRMQRVAAYTDALIEPSPPYVYAVGNQLPRVFETHGVVMVPQAATVDDYLTQIGKHALSGKAVVRAEENVTPFTYAETLRVDNFQLIRDGFDIAVEAPDGGSVLINAPFMPFWQASADGQPVKIIAANMVHMLVQVPAGTHQIELRYKRPRLIDAF
ncbi:MAG: hypothetical protein HQ513_16445, partial [Rhodospirillales bacterium]|nr:hypothetical protein [Rhodospirillales bacterium]